MSESLLYPEIEPFNVGFLEVSQNPYHRIYYEEYGNPEGYPVWLMHGGPGVAPAAVEFRYFNPDIYRVIAPHQRGVGKSEPFCSTENNTTCHLIEDVITLRAHLGIESKMHVFGGSWGSFLSLAYAIAHPETVASILVRGIFLGTEKEAYESYQRDAEKSREDYLGAGDFFPEEWKRFIGHIPEAERSDLIKAYHCRIHNTEGNFSVSEQMEAAKAWCRWESATLHLEPASEKQLKNSSEDTDKINSTAKLETHYFIHRCFVEDNHILNNIHRIAHLPIQILQGRYDMATPRRFTDQLAAAINCVRDQKDLKLLTPIITTGGHVLSDGENPAAALLAIHAMTSIGNQ
jgi:proline iminopeptidase